MNKEGGYVEHCDGHVEDEEHAEQSMAQSILVLAKVLLSILHLELLPECAEPLNFGFVGIVGTLSSLLGHTPEIVLHVHVNGAGHTGALLKWLVHIVRAGVCVMTVHEDVVVHGVLLVEQSGRVHVQGSCV